MRDNFKPFIFLIFLSAELAIGMESNQAIENARSSDAVDIEQVLQQNLERLKIDQQVAADNLAKQSADDLLRNPQTPTLGNPNGDVTIVKFFDYQCTFCKAAEPRLREVLKNDGNIKLVVKEFPILSSVSLIASKAALASVYQNKYEIYHKALIDHRGPMDQERVFIIAARVGLDLEQLQKDMDRSEVADQIISNFNLARKLKVRVVPGFIVNTHVLSGLSSETVTAKIDFRKEVEAARSRP